MSPDTKSLKSMNVSRKGRSASRPATCRKPFSEGGTLRVVSRFGHLMDQGCRRPAQSSRPFGYSTCRGSALAGTATNRPARAAGSGRRGPSRNHGETAASRKSARAVRSQVRAISLVRPPTLCKPSAQCRAGAPRSTRSVWSVRSGRVAHSCYGSSKKFSSTCLRTKDSSVMTPQSFSIMRLASSGPSMRTRRAFTRSA